MNAPSNEPIRKWLMNNSRLVSAVRLPNNLFSENAGTEVGSDLIVLQKQSGKTSLTEEELRFIKSEKRPSGVLFNTYLRSMSQIVHTEWKQDTDPLRQARHPVPSRGRSGRHRHRYGQNPAGRFSQTLGRGIVPKAYLHSGAAQSYRFCFSRGQAGRANAYACRLRQGSNHTERRCNRKRNSRRSKTEAVSHRRYNCSTFSAMLSRRKSPNVKLPQNRSLSCHPRYFPRLHKAARRHRG